MHNPCHLQALRLLVPETNSFPYLSKRALQYEQLTGYKVALEPVAFFKVGAEILFELTTSAFRDGWLMDPAATGAWGQHVARM